MVDRYKILKDTLKKISPSERKEVIMYVVQLNDLCNKKVSQIRRR